MKKLASWLLMVLLIGLSITIVVLAGTGERAIPADIGCADCPPGATDGEAIIGPSVNLRSTGEQLAAAAMYLQWRHMCYGVVFHCMLD